MKKINKFLIIILLISITTIGCKNKKPIEDDRNNDSDFVIEDEETEKDKTIEEFFELVHSESKASDLAVFIKDNIDKVQKTDGDEMIQQLLIKQTKTIEDLNYKITEPEYLKGLNENMNGILDKTQVHTIEDEEVREYYQELIDGFMTIKRYEEYPAIESDWKALNSLSSYLSDDLGMIIELFQKNQNYEYNREKLDVESIVMDILKTEDIFEKEETDFINSLAHELYALQIHSLLIGPEGNYLEFFVYKDSKEYREIIRLKDDYLDSYYGNIVAELDKGTYETSMDVLDEIDKHLDELANK